MITKKEVIDTLRLINNSVGFTAYSSKSHEAISVAISIVEKYPDEQYAADQKKQQTIIDFVNSMCPDASLPEKIIIELMIANAINNVNSNNGGEQRDPSQR